MDNQWIIMGNAWKMHGKCKGELRFFRENQGIFMENRKTLTLSVEHSETSPCFDGKILDITLIKPSLRIPMQQTMDMLIQKWMCMRDVPWRCDQ